MGQEVSRNAFTWPLRNHQRDFDFFPRPRGVPSNSNRAKRRRYIQVEPTIWIFQDVPDNGDNR